MTSAFSDNSRAQLARVARGGALNLVGAMVAAVTGFGLTIVVTNLFDADVAGSLFSSTSAFLVLVTVAVFGTDTSLAHFMLRFEEQGRGADNRVVLRSTRRGVAATGVVLGAATFIAAEGIADALGLAGQQPATVVRVLAVAVPFTAIGQFALGSTRAFGKMRPTVAVDLVGRSSVQLVAVVLVGVAGGGLVALVAGWTLPYLLAAGVAVVLERRVVARRARRWTGVPTDTADSVRRELWGYTWPRGIAVLSQVIIQRADIVLIGAFAGVGDAAVYAAATRFVVVGQLGVRSIQQVLLPRFAQLLARGELQTVSEVFKIATAWSIALLWPFYAAVAATAPLYLRAFGDGYEGVEAITVVVTMAGGMMLATAAGPLDTLLLMSGRSMASLVNALTALGFNLVFCVVLIPTVGIVGGAFAWVGAVLVRNALTFVQVHRGLGVSPASAAGLVAAAASVVCYGAPLGFLSITGREAIGSVVLVMAIGSIGYGIVLWCCRRALALSALRAIVMRRRVTEDSDLLSST